MAVAYVRSFKKLWLGQPATAQGVVPATAGIVASSPLIYSRAISRVASNAVALVGLLADRAVKIGSWTDVGPVYADKTALAQAGVSNNLPLEDGTVNDGFVVSAASQFGAVSIDVTTAGAGNTPTATHEVAYWNGAWTTMVAADFLVIPSTLLAGDWGTGENLLLFDPPTDWVVGGTPTATLPQTLFNLRIRKTAIPTVGLASALARRVYAGEVYASGHAGVDAFLEVFSDDGLAMNNNVVALGMANGVANALNSLQLVLA
jgi:hypothetical protein